MAKKGENIYKRKDNRWEGRYVKEYTSSGKRHLGYVYGKSYRETKEKLLEVQVKQMMAETLYDGKKKFSCFCDEWLERNRDRVKASTYVKYRNIVKNHIKPTFGGYILSQFNAIAVNDFSHKLLTEGTEKSSGGLAPKTVKDILMILRSIFKYVKQQPGNDLFEIDISYPKEKKREIRILTEEEQAKLVQYLLADLDHCKFGTLFALLTGLRIGEICALRWKDISLRKKTVRIDFTMQRLQLPDNPIENKTAVMIGDPKSAMSARVIPLTDFIVDFCKKMEIPSPQAFVLTGETERYMEPRTLQYRFAKYAKECGIADVHFHTLRHTFATRCVEVGFEMKSLSEILGHSTVKVTLDRYVHPSMELKRNNMDKLSQIGF